MNGNTYEMDIKSIDCGRSNREEGQDWSKLYFSNKRYGGALRISHNHLKSHLPTMKMVMIITMIRIFSQDNLSA